MRLYDVIRKPVLTEKTYGQIEMLNKYTFEVAKDANKTEIAQAFHKVFSIKPLAVNIINMKPQSVRTGTKFPGMSGFVKKAIITLPPGTKLNILGDQEQAAAAEKADGENSEAGKKEETSTKGSEGNEAKAEPKAEAAPAEKPKPAVKTATKKISEGATKPIKKATQKIKQEKE